MTMGQMSEIGLHAGHAVVLPPLGVKWMLLVGMFAWAPRYALLCVRQRRTAGLDDLPGIMVHGICYDFFFVTGQIYVDKKAPLHIRAAAQGFIAFVTLGVGMFVGSYLSGWVVDRFTVTQNGAQVHVWPPIWLDPGGVRGRRARALRGLLPVSGGSEDWL